jgi:hypothetical protein
MELRPIEFIQDDRYRIDRSGTVHALKESKGRARGLAGLKWKPCEPLTLTKARNLARNTLDYPFELVMQTTRVVLLIHEDGRMLERVEPFLAAECIRHDPATPEGEAQWKGHPVTAVGNLEAGWFHLKTKANVVHMFHGESLAAELFKQNG